VIVSDGESYREKIVARAWDDETKIAIFDRFGCSLVNSLFLALYFYFQHVVLDFNAHAAFRCHALFQCHASFRYAYSVFTTDTSIRIVSADSIRDIRILENIATIRIVRISTDSIRG
jgi:hypothetical protein